MKVLTGSRLLRFILAAGVAVLLISCTVKKPGKVFNVDVIPVG